MSRLCTGGSFTNKLAAEVASPTARKPPAVRFEVKGKQPRRASQLATRLKAFAKPAADEHPTPGPASVTTSLANSSNVPTAAARRLQIAHVSSGDTASLGSAEVSRTDAQAATAARHLQIDHASLVNTASLGSAEISSIDPQAAGDAREQLKGASQRSGLSKVSSSENSEHDVWAPKEEKTQAKRTEQPWQTKPDVGGLGRPRATSQGTCLDQRMLHCTSVWILAVVMQCMPCSGITSICTGTAMLSSNSRATLVPLQNCAAWAKPKKWPSVHFTTDEYVTEKLSLGVQTRLPSKGGQGLMLCFPLDTALCSTAKAMTLAASLHSSKALYLMLWLYPACQQLSRLQ